MLAYIYACTAVSFSLKKLPHIVFWNAICTAVCFSIKILPCGIFWNASINHPYSSANISILPPSFEVVYFIQIGVNHRFFCVILTWIHWELLFMGNFCCVTINFSCNRSKLAKCWKSHILQSTRTTCFQISLDIIQLIDLKVLFSVFSIHIHNILLFSLKSYVILMFLVHKSMLFVSWKCFRFSGCDSNFWLKKT